MTLKRYPFSIETLFGGIASTFILFWSGQIIPILGQGISIFTPFPILYLTRSKGPGFGIILLLLTALVIGFFINLISSLFFLSEFGLLSWVMGRAWFKGEKVEWIWLKGFGVSVAAFIFTLYIISLKGNSGFNIFSKELSKSMEQTLIFYKKMGLAPDKAEELNAALKNFSVFLINILPALFAIGIGFTAWFNLLICRWFFKKRYPFIVDDKWSFKFWQLPEPLIWLPIGGAFLLLLKQYNLGRLGLNILIITLFPYLIQGFAIIYYYFDKKSIPLFIRMVGYAIILIVPAALIGTVALGLFDMWLNFRRIGISKKEISSKDNSN
ncbi:MAG: DUF2232 domain-containing protein [Deltaproteobacteria bacterium]|nr:DUF2232 domain-containing protein [Deltaproteobacteria bacterium]